MTEAEWEKLRVERPDLNLADWSKFVDLLMGDSLPTPERTTDRHVIAYIMERKLLGEGTILVKAASR
jgi:hypothetical protein